jgi:acetoin utilization deacetylase AcuC-like enzyme
VNAGVLLYHDPKFLQHITGAHPECAMRLAKIDEHLRETGLLSQLRLEPSPAVQLDRLFYIHTPEYVDALRRFAESGGGRIEVDTVVSQRSYEVALQAVGAACDAVEKVLGAPPRTRAVCLIRPPSHHALANAAMGFCLLNSVAVAARTALRDFRLDRVLIVDWDVHHGNGTQELFWEDERVGFLSIHRWPFYPGTGDATETGGGRGLGTTLNLPIEFGSSRKTYLETFENALERFASKIRPDLVLISAGFDSHRLDPIGSLRLEVEDFRELTRIVCQIANQYGGGRIVSLLEGGYNTQILPLCVAEHLKALMDCE